jgi:hypothetical protein
LNPRSQVGLLGVTGRLLAVYPLAASLLTYSKPVRIEYQLKFVGDSSGEHIGLYDSALKRLSQVLDEPRLMSRIALRLERRSIADASNKNKSHLAFETFRVPFGGLFDVFHWRPDERPLRKWIVREQGVSRHPKAVVNRVTGFVTPFCLTYSRSPWCVVWVKREYVLPRYDILGLRSDQHFTACPQVEFAQLGHLRLERQMSAASVFDGGF